MKHKSPKALHIAAGKGWGTLISGGFTTLKTSSGDRYYPIRSGTVTFSSPFDSGLRAGDRILVDDAVNEAPAINPKKIHIARRRTAKKKVKNHNIFIVTDTSIINNTII